MYQFLRGIITEKIASPSGAEKLILDVNGIGFEIFISSTALELIGKKGDITTVYTTLIQREEGVMLIGFPTLLERELFNLLFSVSGIGAKTALSLLNSLTVSEIAYSILNEDSSALSKAQGIGERTASRIILELKEKIKSWSYLPIVYSHKTRQPDSPLTDARSVLQSLGYSTSEINLAFNQAKNHSLAVEDPESLTHFALKWLSTVKK